MKIVLSSESFYWNLDMPIIQQHINNVIYVNYTWNIECEERYAPNQFNIEECICCGAPNPGYDSANYRNTAEAIGEFTKSLDKGEDLLFLCDTSYASMYIFRAMSDYALDYQIHLVMIHRNSGDEYNSFFGARIGDKRQMQNKLLFIKNLKSVVSIPEGCEEELDVESFLNELLSQITQMKNGLTYVYDPTQKEYLAKRITMGAIESAELRFSSMIREVPKGGTLDIGEFIPFRHDYDNDVPRSDGKQVCAILKEMRKKIVEANELQVTIEECDFKGACAGTCPKCEAELLLIEEQLKKIPEEDRVYPQIDIVEKMKCVTEEM